MSNMQKLLRSLADEMRANTISARQLDRMAEMLNGINGLYHEELILAAFRVKEQEEEDA